HRCELLREECILYFNTSIYKMKTYIRLISFCVMLVVMILGCKKFVQVDPPTTSITNTSVYNSDATAAAVMTGIYAKISSTLVTAPGNIQSLTTFCGLSSDEFSISNTLASNLTAAAYYHNSLSATLGYGTEYWTTLFPYIFICNSAVEGVNGSPG